MPSYSTGLVLDQYLPGNKVWGYYQSGFRGEFANGSGGSKATATITTTVTVDGAAGDSFSLYITPAGQPTIQVLYTLPDPVPTGADLQTSILDEIKKEPRLLGLGTWTSDATQVSFESLEPGQRLSITTDADAANFGVAISATNGEPFGYRIKPGRVVVQDFTKDYATTDQPASIAALVSQNLNLVASDEQWLGITMRDTACDVNHGHPDYSSYQSTATYLQPQLTVNLWGDIAFDLETPYMGKNPPQLNYRFEADGDKDDIGILSFETGPGLVAVPVGYRMIGVSADGMTAAVDFDRK